MSSQAQGGPSVPKEEKEKTGLGRMIYRMKTVLKKDKRKSTIAQPGPSSAAGVVVKKSEPPMVEVKARKIIDLPGSTQISRSQVHEERARKLGERYGLEIKPSEWHSTEGHALRVEKPIRMRVHRQCHKCDSYFGLAKECPKCQHSRCKQCVRYPARRTEDELAASRVHRAAILKERADNAPIVPDYREVLHGPQKPVILKITSKTGGQDLIHKKPRQRVRRTCHECSTFFKSGIKECHNCGHERCTDCPRDPAKKDKYPYGYPGDAFGPSAIPHYECHECKTKFPPNPDPGHNCSNCAHKRCDGCPRMKPQKVDPEPDPAVLRSVEAKMAALRLQTKK